VANEPSPARGVGDVVSAARCDHGHESGRALVTAIGCSGLGGDGAGDGEKA
jgi:hypothetical protein